MAAVILSVQGLGQENQQLTMSLYDWSWEVLLGSELPQVGVTFGAHIARLPGTRMILLSPSLGSFHCAPIINVKGVIAKHRMQEDGEMKE